MGTSVTGDVRVKRGGTGAGPGDQGPGGGGGPGGDGQGGQDWPPGWSREDSIAPAKYRIGMWVGLASILMLFVALTSAYIVRQGKLTDEGPRWDAIALPPLLWLTTALLLVSSVSLEVARHSLKRNRYKSFKNWILLTTILGALFLVGQLIAWRQLVAQGVYVNWSPHSSFFYLLTSLHGLHLLGGVIALAYVTSAAVRMRIGFKKRNAVDVTALYWHFMDGLWVYLFLLLFFWR